MRRLDQADTLINSLAANPASEKGHRTGNNSPKECHKQGRGMVEEKEHIKATTKREDWCDKAWHASVARNLRSRINNEKCQHQCVE